MTYLRGIISYDMIACARHEKSHIQIKTVSQKRIIKWHARVAYFLIGKWRMIITFRMVNAHVVN